MNNKIIKIISAIIFLGVVTPSYSQNETDEPLITKVAKLKAQLEIQKLKREIQKLDEEGEKAKAELEKTRNEVNAIPDEVKPVVQAQAQPTKEKSNSEIEQKSKIKLVNINSFDNEFAATIKYDNLTIDIEPGQILPDGESVESIGQNFVTIKNTKGKIEKLTR